MQQHNNERKREQKKCFIDQLLIVPKNRGVVFGDVHNWANMNEVQQAVKWLNCICWYI